MSEPRSNFIYKSTCSGHGNRDGWWFAINEFQKDPHVFFDDLLYVGPFDTPEEALACHALYQNTGFSTSIMPESITADLCGISRPNTSVDLIAAINNQCIDSPRLSFEDQLKRYYDELADLRNAKLEQSCKEQVLVDRSTLEFLLEEFEQYESVSCGGAPESNTEVEGLCDRYGHQLSARVALGLENTVSKSRSS
jgi:hypothetical protein